MFCPFRTFYITKLVVNLNVARRGCKVVLVAAGRGEAFFAF